MIKHAFLILTILLTSCSTILAKPDVNIIDVQFQESTLLETNLQIKIRIINPGNKTIVISGSKHNVKINDYGLGKAQSSNRIELPPLGEVTDTLILRMSNLKLMTKLERLINSNNFTYEIDSTFYTNQLFGLGTMNTVAKGSVYTGSNEID